MTSPSLTPSLTTQQHKASLSRWADPTIILAILLAMWPLLGSDFSSLDDPATISGNKRFNPVTLETLKNYWTAPAYGLYVPVTYTVWSLLSLVARTNTPDPSGIQLNPWIFHSANVAFHIISALTVRRILMLLIRNRAAALIGALLYAVHPLQVEAVGWTSGTKDVLAGMFGLIAICLYLRWSGNDRKSIKNIKSMLRYVAALLSLATAMLSKPSAMTVPVLIVILDWLVIRRPLKNVLQSAWPWLVISGICMIVARMAQPATGIWEPPLWARPFIVGDSIAFYLYKLIWPMGLAVDYGRHPQWAMQQPWFYFTWIAPAALLGVLWWYRKRSCIPLAALLVFAIAPAPVLGLVTFLFQYFSTPADHYVYLAMLGPALALGWLLGSVPKPWLQRLAIAVIVLLGIRTHLQSYTWRDDFALFGHSVEVSPNGLLALNNLGSAY